VNEEPLTSADRRYLVSRRQGKLVVTERDGRLVREFSSPYIVSMVAWSPRGHRLAYTTSGFPDPHELFLFDPETGTRRRIFASGTAHFDWVTWSPDGRWLLLDGDDVGGWRIFSAESGKQVRRLPRLGGRPLWCCPVSPYDALGERLN
jgi:Tol biopolymer transport system component